MDLGLPNPSLIVLVARHEHFIVPQGSTVPEEGDALMVLAGNQQRPELRSVIEGSPNQPDE